MPETEEQGMRKAESLRGVGIEVVARVHVGGWNYGMGGRDEQSEEG